MRNEIYEIYGEFLSGQKLDVSRRFHDPSTGSIVERTDYLRQISKGKKVLHIGCLDHPHIILEKVQNNTWLHGLISEVSELCIGIDVNTRGCNFVRSEIGIDNIQVLDLSKALRDDELANLRQVEWDLILCPEILEHITNHQKLLQNLASLAHRGTSLIVTGPNAFRFANFVNTLRRFEELNTDHSYWFSFYTLSHILAANGWQPSRLIYYDQPKEKLWLRVLSELAVRISRAFSDGLIIEASLSRKDLRGANDLLPVKANSSSEPCATAGAS
jgi:hypothetical protein